jgi:hypothetical protein
VSAPLWVLDTGALVGFAHGAEQVGQIVADAADVDARIAVPVICLLEAYRVLDHTEHDLIGPVRANPVVVTVPVVTDPPIDTAPTIGAMARHTGSLGAAHAVYTALTAAAGIVTSRSDRIRAILGAEWHIVEV